MFLFFILPDFAALQCSSVCAQSWVPVRSHPEDLSFKWPVMGSLPISLCACAAPGTRDLQCSGTPPVLITATPAALICAAVTLQNAAGSCPGHGLDERFYPEQQWAVFVIFHLV